jgi:hypothetical protein
VPAGVPAGCVVDVPPTTAQATQEIIKSAAAARTIKLRRTFRLRIAAREERVASISSHAIGGIARGPRARGGTRRRVGPASERTVVVTVTVGLAVSTPSRVTEAGATEQVAAAGAPEQLRDTSWLKPPIGATLSV